MPSIHLYDESQSWFAPRNGNWWKASQIRHGNCSVNKRNGKKNSSWNRIASTGSPNRARLDKERSSLSLISLIKGKASVVQWAHSAPIILGNRYLLFGLLFSILNGASRNWLTNSCIIISMLSYPFYRFQCCQSQRNNRNSIESHPCVSLSFSFFSSCCLD